MAEDLAMLLRDIRACRICRDEPLFPPALAHEPRPVLRASMTARLCVAGQAPGTRVHASGMPFSDPSGVRLRQWMGVTEAEFYDETRVAVAPMGLCFPGLDDKGGDLPPRRECARIWHDRLFAALPNIELVLAVGRYAHAYHLKGARKMTLTETMCAWREVYEPGAAHRVLPLPHPSWRNSAWLKRNPWFEAELIPVLRAEVRALISVEQGDQA
jgi:uracil-DNA glycosylase